MILQKTIKAKIFNPTRTKEQLLCQEYENYQILLHPLITNNPNCIDTYASIPLYSATKQQALRSTKKSKLKPDQNYPLIIRRDVFKIQKKKTKITKFWARIPISGIHGRIWVPLKLANKHRTLLKLSIRQVRLTKRNNDWFLDITVQKQTQINISHNPRILSIDLGEKNLAASVELLGNSMKNPKLYGREARGIRRHHAWLRKKLGRKKKLKTIKKLSNKEKRIINDLLHKISNHIVNQAVKTNVVIVHGDLKGIRKNAKGKRMNRIVSNMPYYTLTQYITYKAFWKGIPVFQLKEHYTSKTCHKCKNRGKRLSQGLFKCPSCNLQYNADLNAAINIANRFSDYMLENGVTSSLLRNDLNSPLSKAKARRLISIE